MKLGESAIDTARQEDQRHPILLGIGDDIDGIGHTGAKRRHENWQRARGVPMALGHKAGRIFMPGEMEGDARAFQSIHQRQHFAAGNAESMRGASSGEACCQAVSAALGARQGVGLVARAARLDIPGVSVDHGASATNRAERDGCYMFTET